MEQRRGKWDIVVYQLIICDADWNFENCSFVNAFIDVCADDVISGFIGTRFNIGSDIIFRFTDRLVGTYGFFDYGGFFGTGFIISVVDTFTDNGLILIGCRREALHRSHRRPQQQPHRADQR